MGRGGMVAQKHRRVEGSTGIEVNTKVEQWTYLGQLYGQTLEEPRTDLGESQEKGLTGENSDSI